MISQSCNSNPSRQRGIALFIALVLLVVVTIIGLASVRTGVMETQMATSEEMRIASLQTAQSAVDAVLDNEANTQVFGAVGRSVCTADWPTACTLNTITLPTKLTSVLGTGDVVRAKVEREAPLFSPPPRGLGYSIVRTQAARFKVDSQHDGSANNHGWAEIVQGTLVLIVKVI